MKQKVYIETSVISYLVAKPSNNIIITGHQLATQDMWKTINNFDIYISDIVIQEASKRDEEQVSLRLKIIEPLRILEIDDEAKHLANILLKGKAIPKRCPEDALHIAIAVINGMDFIITWNFKHINNPFTKAKIRQLIEGQNYHCPELCSPDEFIGEEK